MIDFKEKMIATDPKLQALEAARESEEAKQRFNRRRPLVYLTGIAIAIAVLFSTAVLISGEGTEYWISKIPFLGQMIAPDAGKKLAGEESGRINILLLGMGGEGHDGAYLTDTIMLASLDPVSKKAALLSIPRDLSLPVAGVWRKVNSINALAEAKKEDGGAATSAALSQVLGIPIDYYIRVDFQGFVNIVDELGGVKVEVENTLDDYQYPILGQEENPDYYARFEHLHIESGSQTMDGSLALKYARSRHGLGQEGSDFARSKRQQRIITAVKDKLLDRQNLLKPVMIAQIIGELNKHISTNLKVWEAARLWDMFKGISKEDISNIGLDDGPGGYLTAGRGDEGAYILLPRDGNFSEIKALAQNILSAALVPATVAPLSEAADIDIKNATVRDGLAGQASAKLKKYNFHVLRANTAAYQDAKETIIYDLTYGEKPAALQALKQLTGAAISYELPDWLKSEIKTDVEKRATSSQPDFILILGANYLP